MMKSGVARDESCNAPAVLDAEKCCYKDKPKMIGAYIMDVNLFASIIYKLNYGYGSSVFAKPSQLPRRKQT